MMNKLFLVLVALFMSFSVCAEEYLYMDNTELSESQLGGQVTLPVKAHFDYYVSAFQVDFEFPDGLTPVGVAEGSDLDISYFNKNGVASNYHSKLYYTNGVYTRFICANQDAGYWQVDGAWTMYGAVKWNPGNYDEMFNLTFNVSSNFEGGQIMVITQPSSGQDTRGPICPRDQHNYHSATITVGGPGPGPGPDPVIENYFSMNNTSIFSGDTFVVPVMMNNTETITAFQTDIVLPEGFEVAKVNGEYSIAWSDRVNTDHVIMANEVSPGVVRLICYSPTLQPFAGNNGVLFNITLQSSADVDGDYTLVLDNTLWTTTSQQELVIDDATCQITANSYILGDANKSGTITVTDVVTTARYILNYNPTPFVFEAADVNGDGNITVTDVVMISRLVMGANLNAPRFMPGFAFSSDRMGGNDINIAAGETRTVAIQLDNVDQYAAFQLELSLPEGLTASNFAMTSRAGNHAIDAVSIGDGKMRVLCYSPVVTAIEGNSGALFTFDVTASGAVAGEIVADRIEMVSMGGSTVSLDVFGMMVNNNNTTRVNGVKAATRIYSEGRNIIVECPIDMTVVVTDIAGRSQQINVQAGRNVIPGRDTGVHVVNAGGVTAKLMLR